MHTISARIAEGALILAFVLMTKPNEDINIAAITLFPAGLGVLMLSTIGFIGLACVTYVFRIEASNEHVLLCRGQHSYSDYLQTTRMFRALGLVALVGIALSIAGDILGTHVNHNASVGLVLRHVAAGVYAGLYVLLLIVHCWCLSYLYEMRSYRRRVSASRCQCTSV
jgi:hypothetical protein